MARSFRDADHLPKRDSGTPARPEELPRQRAGRTPHSHGRYPDYDVELDPVEDTSARGTACRSCWPRARPDLRARRARRGAQAPVAPAG